jgi:antitoxin HicB
METPAYAVQLEPAKEGGYVVTCRDLPELVTQGDDFDEALVQARDAMDEVLPRASMMGRSFPNSRHLANESTSSLRARI